MLSAQIHSGDTQLTEPFASLVRVVLGSSKSAIEVVCARCCTAAGPLSTGATIILGGMLAE
jgi:hypothetical protein